MALERHEEPSGAGFSVGRERGRNIVSEKGRKRSSADEKSDYYEKIAKHVRLLTPKQRVS